MCTRLSLTCCFAIAAIAYVVTIGIGWQLTALHGDYGLRDTTRVDDGQMITVLAPGGAASLAGLQPGDVIIDLDGTPGNDDDAYWQAFLKTPRQAGSHASLAVRRQVRGTNDSDGAPVEQIDITLGSGLGIAENVERALSYSIVGLIFLATVSLVALARPSDAAARVLFVAGICAAFAIATAIIGNLVENIWVARIHYALAALTVAAALHLSLVFPTANPRVRDHLLGRRLAQRFNALVALNYMVPLVLAFALSLATAERWFYLLLLFWAVAACACMFVSYGHARTASARAQLRWVFFALTGCVGAWLLGSVVPVVTKWTFVPLPDWVAIGSFVLFPAAIGLAILRYRLFDIDVIINRTLVYGSVTALLAGLFAGLSIITQRLVLAVTGQESQAAVVVAALVVTALFQPLRARVQVVVDRRFYRRKYDATQTLERFALHIRDEVELDRLAAGLLGVVQETMQPTDISLWLRPTAGAEARNASPRPSALLRG